MKSSVAPSASVMVCAAVPETGANEPATEIALPPSVTVPVTTLVPQFATASVPPAMLTALVPAEPTDFGTETVVPFAALIAPP